MSDREDKSNLPPIPDGGLTEAMPDWLRRPPAWRTLPDREVTPPVPEATGDLPEPDESVIDPRTFLGDDDLPEWLRTLGHGRVARLPVEPGEAVSDDETSRPDARGAGTTASGQQLDRQSEQPASRFVPTTPPVAPTTSKSNDTDQRLAPQSPSSRPEPATSPAWQGAWVVALLASLLVVAIAVIVVLVL